MKNASRKPKLQVNFNSAVTSIFGSVVLIVLIWVGNKVSGVFTTVNSHSSIIETIPSIKEDVKRVNDALPKLVTWDQLNTKLAPQEQKLNDIAKEQQDEKIALAKQEAIRDALSGRNPSRK